MKTYLHPEIVQVVPFEDHTVVVYFADGKIVRYDVNPYLNQGVFRVLNDMEIFMKQCTILNDTLAWDIAGNRDEFQCIDIDPLTLYALPNVNERIA